MSERPSQGLTPELQAELDHLLSEIFDGDGGEATRRRIADIVGGNRAATLYYVESIYLNDELSRNLSKQTEMAEAIEALPHAEPLPPHTAAPLPSVEPAALFSPTYWRNHKARFAALAMALTLLFWAGFYFLVASKDGRLPGDNQSVDQARTLAHVSDLRDVVWAEGAAAYDENAPLTASDSLELASGFVRIRFADGAVVLLEGPTRFQLDTSGAGTLTHGRLVAHIQHSSDNAEAIPFSITTPLALVIDLGTKFGVAAEKDGTTHIEVFEGLVEATPRGAAKTPQSQTIQLTQGESAHLRTGATQFENDRTSWDFVQEMPPEGSPVIRPVGIEYVADLHFRPPELLIDGSGLTEVGPIASWTHSSGQWEEYCWKGAASELPATLVLDLGAEYDLQSLWIWNYSHPDPAFLVRCTRRVRVEVSTDGESFTEVGELELRKAAQQAVRGERLGMHETARYVRIILLECEDSNEVGLGELRFEGMPRAENPSDATTP